MVPWIGGKGGKLRVMTRGWNDRLVGIGGVPHRKGKFGLLPIGFAGP